jgi:hypothetical protein
MNENDLRDCFAMFASLRIGLDGTPDVMLASAERCYAFADAMLEARKSKEEVGIKAVRKKKEL